MKRSILIILCLIIQSAHAQVGNVIPPAPTTREFNKYLNFDVSLYHGIPEISIPLYEIKLNGIILPINLTYHASGVKFGQTSGNVGLGWVINPGYRISRTVYGYPDELVSMPQDITASLNQHENNAVTPQGIFNRDGYLSTFTPDGADMFGVPGKLDGEFDQFRFSLPNKSGSFLISDRTNKTITSSEETNLSIEYKTGQSSATQATGITGLKITDERGIKYSFGEYDQSANVALEHTLFSNAGYCGVAWGITNITVPTGEQVAFKYIQGDVGENSVDYNKTFSFVNASTACPDDASSSSLSSRDDYGWYKTIFPAEIQTGKERVVFNHTLSPNNNRLNDIIVYSSLGQAIRKINFFYHDGFYAYTPYHILDSVTVCSGNSNIPVETYRFSYYNNRHEGHTTTTQDQLGFLMEGNPNNYFHNEFADDAMLFKEPAGATNVRRLDQFISNFSRRERTQYDEVPNYYCLKRITYPTGGYTEYEYEHNLYTEVNSYNVRTAGIRVKKIGHFDVVNNQTITRNYKYGSNESGYGQATLLASHQMFVSEKLRLSFIPCGTTLVKNSQRVITYATNMQGDAASDLFQSGFVWYPQVTEYLTGSDASSGKIVHLFHSDGNYQTQQLAKKNVSPGAIYSDFFPVNISSYRVWDKPYLDTRHYYDKNDVLIKTEGYSYETYNRRSFTGLKVKPFATADEPLYFHNDRIANGTYYFGAGGDRELQSFFDYGTYTVEIGGRRLTGKSEIDYRNGGNVTTYQTYEYNHDLLAKETIKKSSGDNLITYTVFPVDYAAGTPFIDDMKSHKLIGLPVEKVSYLERNGTKTIVFGSINVYKTGGKGLVGSQWLLDSSIPVTASSFKVSNLPVGITPFNNSAQTNFLPDPRYQENINFDSYDRLGNPQQLQKTFGPSETYLWGYNSQYPVAEVKNATYQQLLNILGQAKIDQLASSDPGDDTTVRNLLSPLRTSLPGSLVSIYTYKPLVGITSATDAKGETTFYEYDSFGRLTNVRDTNGNIIKHMDYHYKP